MQISTALTLLPLLAGSIQAQDINAIISELSPYVTQLSSLVQAEATPIISELSELIQALAPTGVVSDLPAVLATNIQVIDSAILALVTEGIPAGAIPTELAAEIPIIVSEAVDGAISDLNAILTELPGTLSNAAVPSLLASYIPILASEIQAEATSLLPQLSGLLATATPGSTVSGSKMSTATKTASATPSTKASGTTSARGSATPSIARTSGATVERMGWGLEIAAVMGFAALVAAL